MQAHDDAREIVAEFVSANRNDHVVIFGKNTSEAVKKLSYRFPFELDDVVPVSLLEHHSDDLPWRARARVGHIGVDAFRCLDEPDLGRLPAKRAGRVKLVAITGEANLQRPAGPIDPPTGKVVAIAPCAQPRSTLSGQGQGIGSRQFMHATFAHGNPPRPPDPPWLLSMPSTHVENGIPADCSV